MQAEAVRMLVVTAGGRGARRMAAWMSLAPAARAAGSSGAKSPSRPEMVANSPDSSKKVRKAAVVTAKPAGTGSPTRLAISPRLAHLPPT